MRHRSILSFGVCFVLGCFPLWARAKVSIRNFQDAKKWAARVHEKTPYTIYCHCHYQGKSVDLQSCGYKAKKANAHARKLEWEHVVPAEAFGQSFLEWRVGSPKCIKRGRTYKGRRCAEKNSEFNRMEADLYNLWPEIGELNRLRSNYSMAELSSSEIDFGECKVKIRDRKFEPMGPAKGIVARVYQYMDAQFPGHGIISEKNRKLFEAWDHMYPVSSWECERAEKIEELQGNPNLILKTRCTQIKK